jgi:hypothetical protein
MKPTRIWDKGGVTLWCTTKLNSAVSLTADTCKGRCPVWHRSKKTEVYFQSGNGGVLMLPEQTWPSTHTCYAAPSEPRHTTRR